jgi:FMN phosphatase YigB (HAD superfamily)
VSENSRLIRAVLLDVGGTLWPERFTPIQGRDVFLINRLCKALPALARPVAAALLGEFDVRAASLSIGPTQDTNEVVRDCAQFAGVVLSPVETILARRALCIPIVGHIEPFPGAGELLEDTKRRRMRTILVSNAVTRDGETYLKDFLGFGLDRSIDSVISSVDVGFRKPHPAMFEAALVAAGCVAEDCVMVGNSEVNDVEPAKALGMRAVRVCIEQPPPVESAADAIATSLNEVAAIIDEWGQ